MCQLSRWDSGTMILDPLSSIPNVLWMCLLLLSCSCHPVLAHRHPANAPSVLFHRLCCGNAICSSRLHALELRLVGEGGGGGRGVRAVDVLVSAGVLPSHAAGDANVCASISPGQFAAGPSQQCSWVRVSPSSSHFKLHVYCFASPFSCPPHPSPSPPTPSTSAHKTFSSEAVLFGHRLPPPPLVDPAPARPGRPL